MVQNVYLIKWSTNNYNAPSGSIAAANSSVAKMLEKVAGATIHVVDKVS